MGSSFYSMILNMVVNVVCIVLSILVFFTFLIIHMVFILLKNCTVVK